jgi:predicted MarR family transcription regulator
LFIGARLEEFVKRTTVPDKFELHNSSHLDETELEGFLTEMELALHHVWEGFSRWSEQVNILSGGQPMPVRDVSVLHVVRMKDRPKTAIEIAKFLHREDLANVLYALRKLAHGGFVRKAGNTPRQIAYEITERGREVTNKYAAIRRLHLVKIIRDLAAPEELLDHLTQRLWMFSGVYEQVTRTAIVVDGLSAEIASTPALEDGSNSSKRGLRNRVDVRRKAKSA